MLLRDRFLEYVLERPDVKEVWTAFTEHEFVKGMGDGTLPLENFKFYLIQDYLYLVGRSSQDMDMR
jgi:thiaminase